MSLTLPIPLSLSKVLLFPVQMRLKFKHCETNPYPWV